MKSKLILAALMILSVLAMLIIPNYTNEVSLYPTSIRVNEICSNNLSVIDSEMGYADYIELYNYGEESIPLKGYGLSDDGVIPHQWTFPEVIIDPGQYILVFLSGDLPETALTESLFANFTLNNNGDLLILSDPDGITIEEKIIPEMSEDMVIGYDAISSSNVFYTFGTPGIENAGIIIEDVNTYMENKSIEYSAEAGFYLEDFDLALSINHEQAVIYYTSDGNDPTTDDLVYGDPITITHRTANQVQYAIRDDLTFDSIYGEARNVKASNVNTATVIKAQAYIGDIPYGDMMVKTYFVEETGPERYTLPVISLSVDPDIFFDPIEGIYNVGAIFESISPNYVDGSTPANYNQRGKDWEREIFLEYFDEAGILQYDQTLGARTFGGWSRAYPKKSLKLYARESYGDDDVINYSFFENATNTEGEIIEEFSELVLRNAGNDWEFTSFRDRLMTGLVADEVDVQAAHSVILFINGEYWGIYNLREIMDKDYIASHYEMDKDDVTMIVYSTGEEASLYDGDEEDIDDYNNFITYLETHDLSDDTVYAEAVEMIDVDNVMNYFISQIYFGNLDWPGNNCKLWRKDIEGIDHEAAEGHDGKWRYLLYDTDFGFNLYQGLTSYDHDTLAFALETDGPEWPNPSWSTIIFRSYMSNDQFKDAFILRMMDFLNHNFEPSHVGEMIDYYKELFAPEMEENIDRWPLYNLSSTSSWNGHITTLYTYAAVRPNIIREILTSDFNLRNPHVLSTETVNGEILINSFAKVTNFTGYYYPSIPVTLEAIPLDGYEFIGWTGDITSNNAIIEITLTDDMTLIPIFE